jgi:hypothetical protein
MSVLSICIVLCRDRRHWRENRIHIRNIAAVKRIWLPDKRVQVTAEIYATVETANARISMRMQSTALEHTAPEASNIPRGWVQAKNQHEKTQKIKLCYLVIEHKKRFPQRWLRRFLSFGM